MPGQSAVFLFFVIYSLFAGPYSIFIGYKSIRYGFIVMAFVTPKSDFSRLRAKFRERAPSMPDNDIYAYGFMMIYGGVLFTIGGIIMSALLILDYV